jgi:hypothetical protein
VALPFKIGKVKDLNDIDDQIGSDGVRMINNTLQGYRMKGYSVTDFSPKFLAKI